MITSWNILLKFLKIALPTQDPLVRKRKIDAEENDGGSKKIDSRTQEEKLKDNTTPYWNMSYEKQVNIIIFN